MSFLKNVFKHVGNMVTGGALAARDSRKATERAQAVQNKIEGRQMQRDRMQALREAQIARATGLQQAVTSGAANSSGLAGSQAGMQASALGNLAFSQQVDTGVGVMNMYNRRSSQMMGRANLYQEANSAAKSAAGMG